MSARAEIGHTVATSHAIWNHGTEKVFAVRRRIAEEQPGRLQAALRALLRAAAHCDDPKNAPAIAAILAQDHYLGLPEEVILTSLPGAGSRGAGTADVSVFFANAATFPWRSHALWFVGQMRRWGWLDEVFDPEALAAQVYRPDLLAEAVEAEGLYPAADLPALESTAMLPMLDDEAFSPGGRARR